MSVKRSNAVKDIRLFCHNIFVVFNIIFVYIFVFVMKQFSGRKSFKIFCRKEQLHCT